MKRFVLLALLGLCFFGSQAKVEVIQERDRELSLGANNAFEFKLRNKDSNKLKVNVVFKNVSNDFSIPRNGQSINGKEDLSLKLSRLTTDDNADIWIVFKFEDVHGNCVEEQKIKIESNNEEPADNHYTIVNDDGFLRAVLIK